MRQILTVSELTKEIKLNLENGFNDISVEGEISNFKPHISGHWYFNLKDSSALICCAMWKGYNNYVFFSPADGMKVIISGKITVYPPRGTYQIDIRSMKPSGAGELQAAFERLKEKLAAEGLFDIEHKKPIPKMPESIGIVTAIDGAALKDMVSVAKRRFPLLHLCVAHSKVQGEGAAKEIAENIKLLNLRNEVDLIIVGRGGGSLEDLWAFNEEIVARAIYDSKIPVISAVGHEIDFTIADFAADLRAPTPTAAMELATPDQADFFAFMSDFSYNTTFNIFKILKDKRNNLGSILNSYGFRAPEDKMHIKSQRLDNLIYKVQNGIDNKLSKEKNRTALLSNSLEANNIRKILKKGFVIVRQNTNIIKRGENFINGIPAKLEFYDKEIAVRSAENEQE